MSNEHIPGPWRTHRIRRPNEEVFEILWRDDGDGVESYTYVATALQHSTARLIAAAPVLLSAAQRLLDYFNNPDDHPDGIKDDVIIHLGGAVELAQRGER